MDLFELARENGDPLREKVEELKATSSPDQASALERFATRVEQDGRVSINMRPSVLRRLLDGGKYQNVHEWAQDQSRRSGRPIEGILRKKLKSYYERRVAFDAVFDNSRNFLYGALNIGGVGPVRYGIFCAVLSAELFGIDTPLAYLREDSLNTYVDLLGNVNLSQLKQHVAPHEARQHLAAVKHSASVAATDEQDWPAMLCSESQYIEAIFMEVVTHDKMQVVRISEQEYQTLRHLVFDSFGRTLTSSEQAATQDFTEILQAERNGKLVLERVHDA